MADTKLETKDKVYGAAIILLITILGITIVDINDWYYCAAENSIKECDSLTRYGIEDAKCIKPDGKGDICVAGGIKYPWKPLSEYVNIIQDKEILVESLQECEYIYYNDTKINYKNKTTVVLDFILNKTLILRCFFNVFYGKQTNHCSVHGYDRNREIGFLVVVC